MMYKRQKGLLPFMTNVLGLGLICYYAGFLFYTTFIVLDTKEFPLSALLLLSLILGLFFIFWGCFFGGMFPYIQITREGIRYKYLEFIKGKILWEDIADVIDIQNRWILNGYTAVIISEESFKWFDVAINKRGLWLKQHYGRIIGYDLPVIWISPKMTDEINLIKEWVESSNPSA